MYKKIVILILLFVAISGYCFTQAEISYNDSLYLKAIELTDQYNNSSLTTFPLKKQVPAFLVRNGTNVSAGQEGFSASNIHSANPWNVQNPMDAIILGVLDYLFFGKKR